MPRPHLGFAQFLLRARARFHCRGLTSEDGSIAYHPWRVETGSPCRDHQTTSGYFINQPPTKVGLVLTLSGTGHDVEIKEKWTLPLQHPTIIDVVDTLGQRDWSQPATVQVSHYDTPGAYFDVERYNRRTKKVNFLRFANWELEACTVLIRSGVKTRGTTATTVRQPADQPGLWVVQKVAALPAAVPGTTIRLIFAPPAATGSPECSTSSVSGSPGCLSLDSGFRWFCITPTRVVAGLVSDCEGTEPNNRVAGTRPAMTAMGCGSV